MEKLNEKELLNTNGERLPTVPVWNKALGKYIWENIDKVGNGLNKPGWRLPGGY